MSRKDGQLRRNQGGPGKTAKLANVTVGSISASLAIPDRKQAGVLQLLICVGGVYLSFLSWALLQERITTTKYTAPDPRQTETFTFAIVLNTVQSVFASLTGYAYLYFSSSSASTGHKGPAMAVFPSRKMAGPLLLIAATSSLASPFGYAALRHVNYITFILAKSCKLLPVMALHVSLFGRRYPLHKYAVVAAVTAGVALFAMSSATAGAKKHRKGGSAGAREANVYWGLLLLGINLLFDGLTNSTQDYIFAAFRPYSGPQMMCAQNLLCTLLTAAYLLLAPYLPFLARSAASAASAPAHGELAQAWAFVRRHPAVGSDVLAFSACGAVGQIFIYYTLAHFSSLLLVTVTVTRKMLSMLLSVLWFGHRLTGMQWAGVGLVFGGVGTEALIARREKAAKQKVELAVVQSPEVKKEL